MSKEYSKLEIVSKIVPALTLLCYICGFLVYNTHLGYFGIVDVSVFNLNYLVAGLHYLFLVFLIIAPMHLYPIKGIHTEKLRILWTLLYVIVIYTFYVTFMYPTNTSVLLVKSYSLLICLAFASYVAINSVKDNGMHWNDVPYWLFGLGFGSIFIFGLGYKHIKRSIGGGQFYKKILILEKPIKGFISVDESLKTDTLIIVHENEKEIFFYNNNKICSLKKELVEAEIMIE